MTAAIILAGGRASRLGGADKPRVEVAGRALIDHALAAVSECDPVVVVGDAPAGVRSVWEEPRHGGPAAGLIAGLDALPDDGEVLVLAADLPEARVLVGMLGGAPTPDGSDGVVAVDSEGRSQWLAGRYRLGALRAAAAQLPDADGASLKRLLGGLVLHRVEVGKAAVDLDTWDAIEQYRKTHPSGEAI